MLAATAPALAWLWAALTDGSLQVPTRMFDLDELPNACAQQTLSRRPSASSCPTPT